MTPPRPFATGLGYESPTEHTVDRAVTSAVAASRLFHRLSELEQTQQSPNGASNNLDSKVEKTNPPKTVGIKDRIACFQWTWFTSTMATGGIANVLATVPFRFQWLYIVGAIFFIFNICLFLTNTALLLAKFHLRPGSFRNSFTDQSESLFIPASLVSIGTILINICQYGVPKTGPWLLVTMEVLFWVWAVAAIFLSAGIYLVLWSTLVFPIHTMTPVWVFPAYPLLLTAPFAGNLINSSVKVGHTSTLNTLPIAMAAVTVQGMGFCLSFMILAAFVYRLMTQKLPRDMQRPGVFISVGPSGFTAAGLVQLGALAGEILPDDFMKPGMAIDAAFIFRILSVVIGLWLWGLAVWFFLVSAGSFWKYLCPQHEAKIGFQMTFFSFVFPNTALLTATYQIANAFSCKPLQIVGCAMTGLLVVVWAVIFVTMIRCIWKRELLWPKEE